MEHTQSGQVFNFNIGFKADTMIIDPDLWILSKNKTTLKVPAPVDGNAIVIAPNPSTGQLQVRLAGTSSSSVKIELVNSLGQIVYSKTVAGNTTMENISTLPFAAGIYWVRISNGSDMKIVQKIFVSRK